jgi:hypothetical protein
LVLSGISTRAKRKPIVIINPYSRGALPFQTRVTTSDIFTDDAEIGRSVNVTVAGQKLALAAILEIAESFKTLRPLTTTVPSTALH